MVVAAVLSLALSRWDIFVGVALGLASVIATDLFGWRNSQTDEPYKWPDLTQTDNTGRTAYYYDDEDAPGAGGSAGDQHLQQGPTAGNEEDKQQK